MKWLAHSELPVDVCGVEARTSAFLAAERERTSAASVFWTWLVAEGECPEPSPMQTVEKPAVSESADDADGRQ